MASTMKSDSEFLPAFPISHLSRLKRELKNKHQAVSQDAWRFGKRSPPEADEHLQEPRNAGSRPEAPFFDSLLIAFLDSRVNSNASGAGTEPFGAP